MTRPRRRSAGDSFLNPPLNLRFPNSHANGPVTSRLPYRLRLNSMRISSIVRDFVRDAIFTSCPATRSPPLHFVVADLRLSRENYSTLLHVDGIMAREAVVLDCFNVDLLSFLFIPNRY